MERTQFQIDTHTNSLHSSPLIENESKKNEISFLLVRLFVHLLLQNYKIPAMMKRKIIEILLLLLLNC